MRIEIASFAQQDMESLYDAWERYRDLLRCCPQHSILDWLQIQTFYNGLNLTTRTLVDAAARGSLNTKTIEEANELIETMASSNSHTQNERVVLRKGILELDTLQALLAQNNTVSTID